MGQSPGSRVRVPRTGTSQERVEGLSRGWHPGSSAAEEWGRGREPLGSSSRSRERAPPVLGEGTSSLAFLPSQTVGPA